MHCLAIHYPHPAILPQISYRSTLWLVVWISTLCPLCCGGSFTYETTTVGWPSQKSSFSEILKRTHMLTRMKTTPRSLLYYKDPKSKCGLHSLKETLCPHINTRHRAQLLSWPSHCRSSWCFEDSSKAAVQVSLAQNGSGHQAVCHFLFSMSAQQAMLEETGGPYGSYLASETLGVYRSGPLPRTASGNVRSGSRWTNIDHTNRLGLLCQLYDK